MKIFPNEKGIYKTKLSIEEIHEKLSRVTVQTKDVRFFKFIDKEYIGKIRPHSFEIWPPTQSSNQPVIFGILGRKENATLVWIEIRFGSSVLNLMHFGFFVFFVGVIPMVYTALQNSAPGAILGIITLIGIPTLTAQLLHSIFQKHKKQHFEPLIQLLEFEKYE